MSKRARKVDVALRATLSQFTTAVLHRGGVELIRGHAATHLTDDELDRLCEEWRHFRAPATEADPEP